MSTSVDLDKNEMTMAERQQWLLDRGVQIENSGDILFLHL